MILNDNKFLEFESFMQMNMGVVIRQDIHYTVDDTDYVRFKDPTVLSVFDIWNDGYESGYDQGSYESTNFTGEQYYGRY